MSSRKLKYTLQFEGKFLGYFNTNIEAAQLAIDAGIGADDVNKLVFGTVSTFNEASYNQIRQVILSEVTTNEVVAETVEPEVKTPAKRTRKKKVETTE